MTLEQFVSQLEDSGVISAADIAAFQNSLSPPAESAEDLAKLLVKHKKVTRLQAQLVYQGKGDRLLLGNYLILDKIGAGGMGDVYLAEHRRMERRVALKTLPAAMTRDTTSIQRFQREVKAAAKLTHPNIVTAYDADEANGVHYFVMEYVEGIDLSAVVKKRGVLNVDVAVDYILQAAKGLEFAHNKGVIHRDIKPANLLLDNAGTIKILDMGLARIEEEAHEIPATQLTQDGSVMGTVDYMAPEQAKDTHTADARSDIYSLGCSLYYLLTGESVYRGSTMVNRIMAHQNDPIPSLTGKHILISQDVDAVFQKMVAKKPEDRFQSMSEVIVAIENCIQMKTSSTVASAPSDPELQKFLQSQKVASSPTVVMSADAITAEKPLTDTQNESLTSGFLNHTLGGTSFQPLPKRKKSIGKRGWVLMGAVLAPLIFMAGIVFKIDTPAGTIILEVDQPELAGAVVSVDEQKKTTIKTGEGKEPIEVAADEKTHTLQVTKGGFETFTKKFTVKAGGKETIKVRLEPLTVATNKKPSVSTPAQGNHALFFDGESSLAEIKTLTGATYLEQKTDQFTIECWITPDLPDSSNPVSYCVASFPFSVSLNGNNVNTAIHAGDARNVIAYGSGSYTQLTEGRRHHIALLFSDGIQEIYINGKKQEHLLYKTQNGSTSKTTEKISLSTDANRIKQPTGIGAGNDLSAKLNYKRFFKGIIDEVRISNIARYSKDFTPASRFENDEHTMALYHFDEGSGDLLKDSSGNGHDGKIVGARWVKVDDDLQVIDPDIPNFLKVVWKLGGEILVWDGDKRQHDHLTPQSDIPSVLVHGPAILFKDLMQFGDEQLIQFASAWKLLNTDKTLSLDLSGTSVSVEGIKHLAGLPLHTLALNRNSNIDDKIAEYLVQLENLDTLSIQETRISDGTINSIANLQSLRNLNVNKTAITLNSVPDLAKLNLHYLNVKNTVFDKTAVMKLHNSLPNCEITWDDGILPAK